MRIADASWRRSLEVPVFQPARGFIDLALNRSAGPTIVATEAQSRIDRLEQADPMVASTLRASYPARATDLYAAITGRDVRWPGHGILWADVRGDVATILDRAPRGIAVGR